MDLFSTIFHVGVILAVYNFLWWLIMLIIRLLRGGRARNLFEVYFVRAIRYVFLCDVVFLFSIYLNDGQVVANDVLLSGLILLFYFISRLQNKRDRSSLFTINAGGANLPGMEDIMKSFRPLFDIRLEVLVIVISFGMYVAFLFHPNMAYNNIANWFLENIQGIIDAPVFGLIFKMIGFFFLLSVVFKMVNSVLAILSGRAVQRNFPQDRNDDHFDDYTEL